MSEFKFFFILTRYISEFTEIINIDRLTLDKNKDNKWKTNDIECP